MLINPRAGNEWTGRPTMRPAEPPDFRCRSLQKRRGSYYHPPKGKPCEHVPLSRGHREALYPYRADKRPATFPRHHPLDNVHAGDS